jgi:hypothetical protein
MRALLLSPAQLHHPEPWQLTNDAFDRRRELGSVGATATAQVGNI